MSIPRTFRWTWHSDELEFWDPRRWQPRVVTRRLLRWINANRLRRRIVWLLVFIFGLLVVPGMLGAIATAQGSTEAASISTIDGLSWMSVKDSSQVPLSDYVFATNHGGIFNPWNTALSLVLGMEFAGYMIIVTTAIWIISYALSFQWLSLFASALTGVAHSLTGQVATPMMMTVAAGIGAFFVAYFVMRGYHAKAAVQVVTMLLVAVLGVIFLAEPLADVLSPNGLLAEGRNVGISVAAGLNGNAKPNPTNVITTMQGSLADNFARHPLQVWNFGHVVDESPACRAAWTGGVRSGSDGSIMSAMTRCGDSAAHAKADHPTTGQLGTGLLLLIFGTILLLFGAYLGIKVIRAALDSIYHGFMAIFGFAAGGYVYGPTQTFLIRNIVDSFVAAGAMAAYTVFLGAYGLFLGNLFHEAKGQVVSVFMIGGVVMIVGITQLKRLSHSLERGNEWIVSRVAGAIQGHHGSGSAVLGMGPGSSGHKMSSAGLITSLAALNTVNASPVTELLMGRTKAPLSSRARLRQRAEAKIMDLNANTGVYGADGWLANSYMDRQQLGNAAREGVAKSIAAGRGGINTVEGAAAAVDRIVMGYGGKIDSARAGLIEAGFTDEKIIADAIRTHRFVQEDAKGLMAKNPFISETASAMQLVGADRSSAARRAALSHAADRYLAKHRHPVNLSDEHLRIVNDYISAPTQQKIADLQRAAGGDFGGNTFAQYNGIPYEQADAQRMLSWIGNKHAELSHEAVTNFIENPGDRAAFDAARSAINDAVNSDNWASGTKRTPSDLAPPRP